MKDPEISNVCSERLFARHGSLISHTNSYQVLLHMQDLHKVKPENKKKSMGGEGVAEVPVPAVDLLGVNSP